jgi:flagellar biosynthesis chaperone FliJ
MNSKFKFRLETVLKVRKHEEFLQKQHFAKVLQKKAALEQHKVEINEQLQGRHNQLFNLANRINKAENDVERERKKMLEARRKTLALENLESKQKIQFIKELDKAEQLVMNEIATQRFNRERS